MNYLQYLIKAKGKHNIHSPFVYQLVNDVINDGSRYDKYNIAEAVRKHFLVNTNTIEVTDLGAGSKKLKGNSRRVKDIAKHSVKRKKYAELMFRLANHFKPENIIELGTSLGVTTHYLALGAPHAKVTTLEGCPNTLALAKEQFEKSGLHNVQTVGGNFNTTLPAILENTSPGMVFFDGNHQLEPTLHYFRLCLEKATDHSLFIFDDIHWSTEMETAWQQIKSHPKVTVTIDLFELGLIFFRQGQAKQDFVVRY